MVQAVADVILWLFSGVLVSWGMAILAVMGLWTAIEYGFRAWDDFKAARMRKIERLYGPFRKK